MIVHNIEPVCPEKPTVLILGSFPSVRSRAVGFFYGNPQNRFWRVLSAVLEEPLPISTEEKKQMLISHAIALYDVIASCEIQGSADSTISDVCPADLSPILSIGTVRRIITNGKTAHTLYNRYDKDRYHLTDICLPSTSPANASASLEKLIEKWSIVKDFCL